MFQRIALMGTGSLGTILGAFISKAGFPIDLIDANPAHVAALNEKGATVVGTVEMTVPVHAITPDQMEGEYDLYIYMAKQTYNDSCLPQMKKHSHEGTIVVCCQNGLPEAAVCKYFDKSRVFGAPVGWGATFKGPGVSESTTLRDAQCFTLGTVEGPVTPELREVEKVLASMCRIDLSDNLMGLRWAKLLINAAFSGMSTVIGGTFGDVCDNPESLRIATHIGQECIRVCAADGVAMVPFHGADGPLDFTQIYDFKTAAELRVAMDKVIEMNSVSRPLVASMLQDLRRGLPCEVDAINGVVSETGDRVGIDTPYNDRAIAIIKAKQAGELPVEGCILDGFPAEALK